MAIDIEKSNLSINQIVANKRENGIIDGDCIVPDVKPDILEIVSSSGIVNVYKKEVSEGKVRIDGCISTFIIYVGIENDTRSTRSINHTLDFSQIISVDNVTSDMNSMVEINLNNIECKIINERKVNIKANVNFDIKVFNNTNVEFVNSINIQDLQKLEDTVQVNSVLGIGATKTSIKEVIGIDNSDNLAEILKVSTNINNIDTKTSYNKTLTKADVGVKILYVTEDGRYNTVSKTFPVVGFIDMKDVNEENVCTTNAEIKNMVLKPNSVQEHSLSLDMEIEMSVIAYERREINIIEDLYSPSVNLNFEKKSIRTVQNKSIFRGTFNFNQKELLNIGEEKVYDIDTNVNAENVSIVTDGINIDGNVQFIVTHSTNQMTGIARKVVNVPFNYRLPASNIVQNADTRITANIHNENFNIMPGSEMDLRMDIEFVADTSNMIDINVIDDVSENTDTQENKYNMVIYFTKPEDTIWKIAKKFNSTTRTIIEANNLASEELKTGTKLFISRYVPD